MSWFCATCSRWNRSGRRVCPYCGRPPRGRLCRRCKTAAPRDAVSCPGCGSTDLTEPGAAGGRVSLWLRLGLLAGGSLVAWPLILSLQPWLHRALLWTGRVLERLMVDALIFWMVTGLLPAPLGQRLRRAAGWLIRFFGRLIVPPVR
jgi:RNA polymerase subunit RPABC4/transcription elongation factor Spt4